MNIYFLISIISLFVLYIWIGKQASKKVKTNLDYFLMGRKLTFFPLSMTMLATMLGGGTLVGAAQEAYSRGWIVLIYPLGTFLGCVALSLGFGAKLRRFNIITVPQVFDVIYNSKALRCLAATFSIISLYFILVAQGIAMKGFFVTIGITNSIYFLLFWLVFVGYTVVGGLKAVVDTDIIQVVLIFVGLFLAIFSLNLDQVTTTFVVKKSFFSTKGIPWSSWLLMPLCFMLMGQDMGQRCMAAKSPRIIAPASIFAGVCLLIGSGIAILFGMLARSSGVEILSSSNILYSTVQILTTPIVTNLFIATILMAITSTADSLLCAVSSNVCSDFPIIANMQPKKQLTTAKIVTFCIGVSVLICMSLFNSVVDALMFSYEFSVSTLFVPIVMSVVSSNCSKNSAIGAIIAGIIGFFVFRIYFTDYPRELMTLILSFSTYILVKFLENRFFFKVN
ncbi:MAG: sodium:solute symporter family protein [Rickettsiales bacterium]|nr:sodium:solute symporter family protein [Rickettsiales bacterium]